MKATKNKISYCFDDLLIGPATVKGVSVDAIVDATVVGWGKSDGSWYGNFEVDSLRVRDYHIVMAGESFKLDQDWFCSNFPDLIKELEKEFEFIAITKAKRDCENIKWRWGAEWEREVD